MDFSHPNAEKLTNAIVVIGNQEFHVCKEFLAGHSLFFKEKFFGNPEDVLEDHFPIDTSIDAPKFQKLLELLYHEADFNEHTVSNILEVSSFFKVKNVLKNSMDFLINLPDKKFSIVKKIILADKLELPDLLERVLDHFFALKKLPSTLEGPFEPLRPATAFRIMERSIEQQKSSRSAPGASESKEKLRERLLKAEAQGPEAHMQERAVQLVLQAVNSKNPHMQLIRALCGLDAARDAPKHPIPAREAEDRVIHLLQEAFDPLGPDVDDIENVSARVGRNSHHHHEQQLMYALNRRIRRLQNLIKEIYKAGGPGRVLDGLEHQDWEEVLHRRIQQLVNRLEPIKDRQTRHIRRAPINPEAFNLRNRNMEDEERMIQRLRERFPSDIPVELENVPEDVREGTPQYEQMLFDALGHRNRCLKHLKSNIIGAGGNVLGYDRHYWERAIDFRIMENYARISQIADYQRHRASATRGGARIDPDASSPEYQRIFRRLDVPDPSHRQHHREQLQNVRGAANVPVPGIQGRPNHQRGESSSSQNAPQAAAHQNPEESSSSSNYEYSD